MTAAGQKLATSVNTVFGCEPVLLRTDCTFSLIDMTTGFNVFYETIAQNPPPPPLGPTAHGHGDPTLERETIHKCQPIQVPWTVHVSCQLTMRREPNLFYLPAVLKGTQPVARRYQQAAAERDVEENIRAERKRNGVNGNSFCGKQMGCLGHCVTKEFKFLIRK
jgi:hypothetical protein